MSTNKDATDFADLGRLKANNGNQNYNIPIGITLPASTACNIYNVHNLA
jgi:hypothetical protein